MTDPPSLREQVDDGKSGGVWDGGAATRELKAHRVHFCSHCLFTESMTLPHVYLYCPRCERVGGVYRALTKGWLTPDPGGQGGA